MASFALFRRPTSSHSPSCVPPSLRSSCFKPVFLSPSANSPTAGTIRSVRLSRSGHDLVLSTNLLAQLKFELNISPFTLISSVELRFISCAVYLLRYLYCAISFNSARVVTRDPKYRFGTSATNEVRRDTSKNSAYKTKIFENSPSLHLRGRFGPDVTHFTFGTGRRDP
jgi:hypothetical protein